MFTKIVTSVTLACFIFTLPGCYTKGELRRPEILEGKDLSIVEVVKTDGELVTFTEFGGKWAEVRDSTLVGVVASGKQVRIPVSEIHRAYVRKTDVALTIFAIIGIPVLVAGVIGLIVLATKQSCPFVYSYDGTRYVFDGEPYGGAICEGLERTDWCKLEHLKPVSDEYRLLLTNEVNETQFTDELKLWVVDHQAGVDIVPDAEGNLYTISEPLKPLRATDGRGRDISRWVIENDKLFWQSDLSTKNPNSAADLRDTIIMEFPKPAGATTAKLLVNGSTTMWGSQMLKRMTELRGETVPEWFNELKNPVNREMLDIWNKREELYKLQVKVGTGGTWVTRGILWGGGPYISEDRVVPLDVNGVDGTTLRVLLAPPAGFWQLNSFAVDYTTGLKPEFQEITGKSMIGHDGSDLRGILSSTDQQFYVMPETGQMAKLTFVVPPQKSGSERTVFAKVSGYYDLRARAEGPAQAEMVNRLTVEPGYAVSYALQEFNKWRSDAAQADRAGGEIRR
jgi:hypothetical protein